MELFYFYLITGLVLIMLEITATTFYLLVIGVIFIISALLSLFISNGGIVALLGFGLSILACIIIRTRKVRQKISDGNMTEHIGKEVEIIEIHHNLIRVKYSGSYWDATLTKKDISDVKVGDVLTIIRYHNNKFEID